MSRERPSAHGKALGETLAALVEAGGGAHGMCLTCAFREGCMTNQMAATGIVALNCAIGVDPDTFACHHGMKEGQPTMVCAGYLAALKAPLETVEAELTKLVERSATFSSDKPDDVRAAFDAWASLADPEDVMDDYERSRLYSRHLLVNGATSSDIPPSRAPASEQSQ